MAEIVVDGVRYLPESDDRPRIGVAITAHNRNDVFARCLEQIRAYTPPGVPIVIVDDASEKPIDGADFRFESNVGIPRAKNKCLELLMRLGVEHLFLWDSDAHPIAPDWWRPYVESDEPHLMAQFLDLAGSRKLRDSTVLYDDGQHVAYSNARGFMLYFERRVIEHVGGFDPIFGRGLFEHGDLSNRIHAAGLTSWRYADVKGSERLIRSLDQHEEVPRSIPRPERAELEATNRRIHDARKRAGTADYVEYRQPCDVVLTCLYSAKPHPVHKTPIAPTLEPARKLLDSLKGHDRAVVINDRIAAAPAGIELVPSAARISLYFQRWLDFWRYLRAHPEIRYAWCVDATDTEMLVEPWQSMRPGRLYIGSEPRTVGLPWLAQQHPSAPVQKHIASHGDDQLVNPGIVGGDRETLMRFCHGMVRHFFDLEADKSTGAVPNVIDRGDMGAAQIVAASFGDRLVIGPRINTVFRANERNGWSFWRHK